MHSQSTPTRPEGKPIELARGTSLGRYIVLDQIGVGGMGAVFAAYDPDLNRRIAVKVLTISDETGRGRLLREAQAMARLSHPNVIAVYDVGAYDAGVFVAMELIEGTTLREWGTHERSFVEILSKYVQAGRGLWAAHRAELVHRDFKSDNVLVGKDGRVSVTDFGLVRSGDADSYDTPAPHEAPRDPSSRESPIGRVTRAGTILGTPEYMSPEQHLGQRTDARSDQFSFCVALYEALYHEHPFGDGAALFDGVMAGKVRPAKPGAKVPGWVRKALLRGLERQADRRYPDMGALLQDLAPERSGRRTWGIVAGLGALAAAAGVWGLAPQAGAVEACQSGEALTAKVWDPAARATVSDAFARTGAPRAADNVAAVSRALDGYLAGWPQMYGEACRKTRVEKVQSVGVLDRRMLCLEGRLDAARRLVALLDQADAALVSRAAQAAYDLPGLSDCADPAALSHLMGQSGEIAAKLRDVQTLRSAGRFREAMALAGDVVLSAREAGGSLFAQALLERGRLELNLEEDKAAVATLTASATTALEQGDELGAAEAWSGLARATSTGLGLLDEAERWGRIGVAVAARAAAGGPSARPRSASPWRRCSPIATASTMPTARWRRPSPSTNASAGPTIR